MRFSGISKELRTRLEKNAQVRAYSKGSILFFEGERPAYFHILLEGILKIYKTNEKGGEIVLHFIMGESFIAEIANIQNIPFPATAAFESDAKVMLIRQDFFQEVMLEESEILRYLLLSVSNKARGLENVIAHSMAMNAKSKIASFLLNNEKNLHDLANKKIAQILNITPETLSRVLAEFKKEGSVERDKGKITIKDRSALGRWALL